MKNYLSSVVNWALNSGQIMSKHQNPPSLGDLHMLLTEAITLLTATSEQEKKVLAEITGKISDLQGSIDTLSTQLANVALSAEQAAAVQAVVDGMLSLDNIVADKVPDTAPAA